MARYVRDRTVRRRDAAVRRLRRTKQALTALSLLFAGIVGTAAARAFPGRASHQTTTITHPVRHSVARRSHPATRPVAGLRVKPHHHHARRVAPPATTPAPPATTPAPAPSTSAAVTSGGS